MLEEDALNVLNQKSCSIILPHWSIALIIDDLFLALQSFFVFFFLECSSCFETGRLLPMSLLAGISCNQVGGFLVIRWEVSPISSIPSFVLELGEGDGFV